jgi:DNA-binding response OmpR family regulator
MDYIRKKIMLVDDDISSRRQGKAILNDLYEVYPLPSAHKLFEVLNIVSPDLILLDIRMPEIDGFETIKLLKSNERYAQIPVMFLTASNDKASVIKGSRLGAAGFITKPFSSSDLAVHIENCLHAVNAEAAEAAEATEASEASEAESEVKNDKPIIIAIDDAPDILKAVHSILKEKYKVYTLSKPEKLHDILKNVKPNLFLLDYNMPELSGFDLIPVIREFPEHKDTPIMFLTSEGTVDHLTVAVSLGACDFIVKPFNIEVLLEKIARHIAL